MSKPKLLLILWHDAVNGAGWENLEELCNESLPLVTSIGFLIHDDENRIILSTGFHGEESIGYMAIPTGMIHSRKFVKY